MFRLTRHVSRSFAMTVVTTPSLCGLLAVLGMAGFLAGCSGAEFGDRQIAAADNSVPAASADQVGLRFRYPDETPMLDAKGLKTFVTQFKHRVVLLDVWALWCRRSREEMPVLAALQDESGADGLQVISCDLDGPDVWRTQTVPFLQSTGANFPCVVLAQESKKELRDWLAPNWSYDLPARFIIDAEGRVAYRAVGDVVLEEVCGEARRLAGDGATDPARRRLADGAAALRIRLIDVRRGRAQSLPEIVAAPADSRRLAEEAFEQIAGEIDRKLNARIAVLPFASSRSRTKAGLLGRDAAEMLTQALRGKGYYDLIEPAQAERMLAQTKLTAMSIDFDPTVVQDRLSCDFLVLGWMRGNRVEPPAGPDAAAQAASDDVGEEAVIEPRQNPESH